jgi:hypothetical protein
LYSRVGTAEAARRGESVEFVFGEGAEDNESAHFDFDCYLTRSTQSIDALLGSIVSADFGFDGVRGILVPRYGDRVKWWDKCAGGGTCHYGTYEVLAKRRGPHNLRIEKSFWYFGDTIMLRALEECQAAQVLGSRSGCDALGCFYWY